MLQRRSLISAKWGLTSISLAVEHQLHIMDGLEQKTSSELPKPAVYREPMTEMDRKHPPAAA